MINRTKKSPSKTEDRKIFRTIISIVYAPLALLTLIGTLTAFNQ